MSTSRAAHREQTSRLRVSENVGAFRYAIWAAGSDTRGKAVRIPAETLPEAKASGKARPAVAAEHRQKRLRQNALWFAPARPGS
jgi:hypothetical protein